MQRFKKGEKIEIRPSNQVTKPCKVFYFDKQVKWFNLYNTCLEGACYSSVRLVGIV